MNIAETLRSLLRRWYIVVPGLLAAAALAVGMWHVQKPEYQRSATQMLLPGTASVPDGGNPYIYIGGLTQAADVVVRALGSRNVIEDVVGDRPNVEVEVSRDPSASGPLILVSVTAGSDADAEAVLARLVTRTTRVLGDLQDQEDISAASRIKIIPVAIDETSVLMQRDRLIAAAGAGLGAVALTLVLAVGVDGLVVARARRKRRKDADDAASDAADAADADAADAADADAAGAAVATPDAADGRAVAHAASEEPAGADGDAVIAAEPEPMDDADPETHEPARVLSHAGWAPRASGDSDAAAAATSHLTTRGRSTGRPVRARRSA
ncbi:MULTISPECIES: hypothetical protein [unclassified Microbacterium]|uniref:hypothetical protein n=1 Tax=unclassified Microbacterium TaxID=2609290 RepID=UPI003868337F